MLLVDKIKTTIRDVNDYPSPGIVFKDITPVLADPLLVREITAEMVNSLKGIHIDAIAAVEARGFIWGSILAHQLGTRFIPVRKSGKLPFTTRIQHYELEYGKAAVEKLMEVYATVNPGFQLPAGGLWIETDRN